MAMITSNLVNARLGRYEIKERIGMGGMARVFKAVDTTLDRTVAIKVLHEHLADDPSFKQRFEREAKFIGSFNHPNIVQIYDYSVIEQGETTLCYMVMPFIPGKTLKSVLEEMAQQGRTLPHERILQIMLNIAAALGYAHERGMIHRDVKPANILFNERDEAVLADFGIARLAAGSQLTQESVTIGTPAYMSPEQASGGEVDLRTDLYSLGVILYEMLAGRPPFADDGSLSILIKHINEPVPRVSEFMHMENAQLDAVIFKALAKFPENRYQTAQAFAEDLQAVFQGRPVSAPLTEYLVTGSSLDNSNTAVFAAQYVSAPDPRPTPAKRLGSPAGILIAGLGTILALLVIALLTQQAMNNSTSSTAATAAVMGSVESMTAAEDFYFVSTFDPGDELNQYWQQSEESVMFRQITPDGQYSIRNELSQTAMTSLFSLDYTYGAATIIMEGQLRENSSRSSAFGIVFHYQDEDNYGVFAVDASRRFSVWTRRDGVWIELRNAGESWTPGDAVNPPGTSNRMTLEIHSTALYGFVNGSTLFDVRLDALGSGAVGVYVATPEQGTADVVIDSYQVTRTVPSMTAP